MWSGTQRMQQSFLLPFDSNHVDLRGVIGSDDAGPRIGNATTLSSRAGHARSRSILFFLAMRRAIARDSGEPIRKFPGLTNSRPRRELSPLLHFAPEFFETGAEVP